MNEIDYTGCWPVAPTPFKDNEELDLEGMKSLNHHRARHFDHLQTRASPRDKRVSGDRGLMMTK